MFVNIEELVERHGFNDHQLFEADATHRCDAG